jgi:ABC-2 type transport system ATP-binding protein
MINDEGLPVPALAVRCLSKRFDGFSLEEVSFELESGYVMGFIGPNGAGKTTTINAIMGLCKRDSGEIAVFGGDPRNRAVRERIGFVFDECPFRGLSAIECGAYYGPAYRLWDQQRFSEYLGRFGIDPRKLVDKLSKGQKMKLSLAFCLSHGAELLIMDEPTSGLDPLFRRELLDLVYEVIQDEGKAVFFSTHITADLERVADFVTFINGGRIVFSLPVTEALERYSLARGAEAELDGELRSLCVGAVRNPLGFTALTQRRADIERLRPGRIVFEKPSLEDIMVYSNKEAVNA